MSSLKQQHETRQQLTALCGGAVQQQITRGEATPAQLRQRRRHLLKALRKHLPQSAKRSPEKMLHTAVMVLALWGFGGLAMPGTAEAAPNFVMANPMAGVGVGRVAAPTFVDIDNDGDLDAFVGEQLGTVKFYQNNGTAVAPSFVAADGVTVINPLAGFDVGSYAVPTFADIDNDGDLDAFVGESGGAVKFYQNNGSASAPNFVVADGVSVINPLLGFDVGTYAVPTFADIDNDGDLDAFVGEYNGTVKFYQNSGSTSAPSFVVADGVSVINPLAGFDVGTYAAPTFADIDNDGDLDAIVGEWYGTVKFYQNNGSASAPSFVAADGVTIINPLTGTVVSAAAKPTFTDIDNDGDLDAFVGDFNGTVVLRRNYGTASASGFSVGMPISGFNAVESAAPTFADIDSDGDLDAFVGAYAGTVKFYQNDGTAMAHAFVATNGTTVINPLAGFDVGFSSIPTFADIDNDGDLDAFVGDDPGTVLFYRNTGTPSAPVFVADIAGNPLAGFDVGVLSAPTFADIDNDGDLDAFVGGKYGTVKFYQNNGSASAPSFVAANGTTVINPLAGFDVGFQSIPTFADIDNDGDLDAFVGEKTGMVKFYQNNGSATSPNFVAADGVTVINPLAGFDVGFNAAPTFADIDNDGDLDAFVGGYGGDVKVFINLESVAPNAVNDSATTEVNTILNSSVSLLANDSDANGDTLSVVAGIFATTQSGSIVINSDGIYTYTPPANFTGTDMVDYTVSDGSLTAVGALTINVTEAASSGGGGGGAPGLPLIATLAALLPWRARRRTSNNPAN